MTESFTIEPVAPGDVEGLAAAVEAVARERRYLAAVDGFGAEGTRTFVDGLARGGGVQLVVRSGRRVVGWCDVQRHAFEGFRHGGVLGIGLLPEWRAQGVGASLLARTLQAAEAAGMTRVELEVFASNTRAIRLFEAAGFVREGVKRGARVLDGQADDVVCMARLV